MRPDADRLQITLYARLMVDVVGPESYLRDVWSRWCERQWRRLEPFGAATFSRAGWRPFDVPVGGCVRCGLACRCSHDLRRVA